jgi:hypothetical protein
MNKRYIETSAAQFTGLPLPFKFLFEIRFDTSSSEKIARKKFGVEMPAYNTTVFPPKGHYKPISRMIDYKLLQ